jgi:hypothetical protein
LLRTIGRVALVVLALAALVLPLPAAWVETWYSRGLYPLIQNTVTPITNAVPMALLDVAALVLFVAILYRSGQRVRLSGFVAALPRGVLALVTLSSTVLLAFLVLWGLNYRRVPLEQKLDFDASRVTDEAARQLGEHAVSMVNATYDAAQPLDQPGPTLDAAFATTQRLLGSNWLAVPGRPKRSLLGAYFLKASIAGMTDPFFLEIILNPDLLPAERPFVMAHEWAHLAGYAHEAEASFVAWLTCMQASPSARYSGWLAVYEHVSAALPRAERSSLAARLAAGPRRDLEAIGARFARGSPMVRRTARDAYDAYLRANRVEEGIDSYTGMLRLVLGARIAGRT